MVSLVRPSSRVSSQSHNFHVLMGHPSSDAIDHLFSNVLGLLPPSSSSSPSSAPRTIDCEECLQTKSHQIVSRRLGHELGASKPFETTVYRLRNLTRPTRLGTRPGPGLTLGKVEKPAPTARPRWVKISKTPPWVPGLWVPRFFHLGTLHVTSICDYRTR